MQINGISIGSNIDTSIIIKAYQDSFTARYITPLENQKTVLDNQNTVINQIISRLTTLSSKLLGLQSGTSFLPKSASSSDETILTAAADDSAATGVYDVNVSQLAQKHKVASAQFSAIGTDIISAIGAGTKQFRITINGTNTDVSVDLVAGDNNQAVFTKMAAAINGSGVGAVASVVNETGTSARLVVSGNNSGLVNAMSMQDLAGGLLLNSQVIDGGGAFSNQLQVAQDALFSIDSLNFQRSSNSVSDAMAGVTLQLKKAGAAQLQVGGSTDKIVQTIQDFIDDYNKAMDYTKEATSYDSGTKQAGVLLNNPVARNLIYELRPLVSAPITGLPNAFNSLASIGIDMDKTGKLSIVDQNKLENAIETNLTDVKAIFGTPTDGVASRLRTYISQTTSAYGALFNSQSSISSRIRWTADLISAKDRQLTAYTGILIAKFSALDALLSKNSSILSSLTGFSLIPTSSK